MIDYKVIRKMEKRILAKDCYTSKKSWLAASEKEQKEYANWLAKECGDYYSFVICGL